jgi:hypothetical protein
MAKDLVIIFDNAVSVGQFNANCNTHVYPDYKHLVIKLTEEQINEIDEFGKKHNMTYGKCWLEW